MSSSAVQSYELIVGLIAGTIAAAFLFPVAFDILNTQAIAGPDTSGPTTALLSIFDTIIIFAVAIAMAWGALQVFGR